MKKRLFSFVGVALLLFGLCACKKDEKVLVTDWPGDAFDFMEGVPQYDGEQYTAEVDEDYETVSVYYKDATLDTVYAYIEQLKDFGLKENISTAVVEGKYQWMSELTEGELFVEIMWYDRDFELESGSYSYSLVIKFAEF